MENRDPPFQEWGLKRTRPFVAKAGPMMKKYLDFGITVALSVADHQDHYLARLSRRARRESCYGLCARSLMEHVTCEAVASFGPDTVINFIFEKSYQFEGARCAFRDLKEHVPMIAGNLGTILPGDKREFAGLMAADLVASLGRRSDVRRQNIWRNSRRRLAEYRPRLGVDIKRRACGAASADVRWSVA